MTTDTEPQTAHTAQTNVIKALSQQIWGSEWIILDEYGDSYGRLERTLAGKLIDALHDVRRLPIDRLDDAEKLDALTAILAGEPVTLPVISVVENLGLDIPEEPEEFASALGLIDPRHIPTPDEAASIQAAFKPFTGRHGTRKAFKYHEDHGEAPCDECRAIVERVKPKEDTTETFKKQRRRIPIQHGTVKGYQAHVRRREPVCDPCREARNEDQRAQRLARNPDTKPRGPARANSARNPAQSTPALASTPAGEWEARLHRQALDGLFDLLPATTDDPFTAQQKARWLAYATLTLDVVWPNS